MSEADVTIIGAGPAGVAAAIQLKRSGISPLLVEKERVGGLVKNACRVENYPGFPGGISGLQLADLLATHLAGAGVDVLFEEVVRLDHDGRCFSVETGKSRRRSRIVMLATGTKPRKYNDLYIPAGAAPYIHTEIYPIRDCTGKRIAIVGAGDAAFDYALNLAENNDIVILNRSEETRCLPLLRKRAEQTPRIALWSRAVIESVSEAVPEGLLLSCRLPGQSISLPVQYLILAIGREPQRDFLPETFSMGADTLKGEGMLYEIGDIRNGSFRQVAIAVGDGIRAAMSVAEQWQGKRA
jgi:thioredoxin reductase (NADPH)